MSKQPINWYRLFHYSKYILEQQLEYSATLLAQTQKRLDDTQKKLDEANLWIRDSKTRQIVIPPAPTSDKPKKLTNWEQYRQQYREDLEVIEQHTESTKLEVPQE